MKALVKDSGDILFGVVLLAHLISSPYAKVEESFNLQAVHDILERGLFNVPEFDHLEFPGVVPRTFLGALAVSVLAWPGQLALKACPVLAQNWSNYGAVDPLSMWLCPTPGISSQILARACLGFLGWLAFRKFRRGVASLWGDATGICLGIVCGVQFHLPYYLTRTLPNTMALVILFYGYGAWFECAARVSNNDSNGSSGSGNINQGGYTCIGCMVCAAVLFRCDVLVIAAPTGVVMLVWGHVTFWRGVAVGLFVGALSLFATVSVDSWLWQRWLWPEGEVLFFNTIENKSSEWGVMPAHWYFTSALPRALLGATLWLLVSFSPTSSAARRLDLSAFPWCLPAMVSVALYSFLPHKELRFIFPALPLFNASAAYGLAKCWSNLKVALNDFRQSFEFSSNKNPVPVVEMVPSQKLDNGAVLETKSGATENSNACVSDAAKKTWASGLRLICWLVLVVGPLVVSCLATAVLASAAQANYPGGHAFAAAHDLFAPGSSFRGLAVHIDAAAAMAGVSRFGERHRRASEGGWHYSKAENLTKPEHFVARAQPGVGEGFDLLVTAKAVAWYQEPFRPSGCAVEQGGTLPPVGASLPPLREACAATSSDESPWVEVHVARGFSGLKLLPLRDWLVGLLGRTSRGNGSDVRGLGWLPILVKTEPSIRVLASKKLAEQLL